MVVTQARAATVVAERSERSVPGERSEPALPERERGRSRTSGPSRRRRPIFCEAVPARAAIPAEGGPFPPSATRDPFRANEVSPPLPERERGRSRTSGLPAEGGRSSAGPFPHERPFPPKAADLLRGRSHAGGHSRRRRPLSAERSERSVPGERSEPALPERERGRSRTSGLSRRRRPIGVGDSRQPIASGFSSKQRLWA
jgi:hypothetical protein